MTLRVHFDGKVLVPDGPVDLTPGECFEIEVRSRVALPSLANGQLQVQMKNGIPVIKSPPGTAVLTSEEVKRLEADET